MLVVAVQVVLNRHNGHSVINCKGSFENQQLVNDRYSSESVKVVDWLVAVIFAFLDIIASFNILLSILDYI